MTNEKRQMENGKFSPSLSRLRLQLNEVSSGRRHRVALQSPQTIRDAERAFHSPVVVAAHLRASLVAPADVVSLAARSLDLLERIAAFRNGEVVFGTPALLDVVNLQAVELHPMDLIASFVIDLAAEEAHRH